jgi:hypothetical protein
MVLTEEELKQIIKEEFLNLVNEEEIDEKLFTALKDLGRGLLSKAKRSFSDMPDPEKSSGVGSWYAKYKEPLEKPKKTGIVRGKPQAVSIMEPDSEEEFYDTPIDLTSTTAQLKPAGLLGTGEEPEQKPINIRGELPSSENIPKQLPAPQRIGIVKDYGKLMSSSENEDYKLLYSSCVSQFKKSKYYNELEQKQKQVSTSHIDTVLKHLVSTKRVIQNPTIAPISTTAENQSRETPSLQQIGQVDFNSWYIKSLIATTKKYFSNSSISEGTITFVIQFLFDQGRLAISQRLYNQLVHTKDPRVTPDLQQEPETQQESINYNKLYENWKRHIKLGVKI